MCEWRIEYLSGMTVGRYKGVKADVVRMGVPTGDVWFCDIKDKIGPEGYVPKLIIAKGTYVSIERVEPKEVDLSDKIKEGTTEAWI